MQKYFSAIYRYSKLQSQWSELCCSHKCRSAKPQSSICLLYKLADIAFCKAEQWVMLLFRTYLRQSVFVTACSNKN